MSLSLERSCGGCSGLHGEMAGDIKRIGVWAGISKGGRDGGSVDLSKSHTVDRVDLLRASCPGRLSSEHQNGAPTHSPGARRASQIQSVRTLCRLSKRRSPGPPRLATLARLGSSFQITKFNRLPCRALVSPIPPLVLQARDGTCQLRVRICAPATASQSCQTLQ